MRFFAMNRLERGRYLEVLDEYYRLHVPEFPELKSLDVLKEVFA
jgi:DNA repair protein RecO (recombination protein O)